MKVLIFIFSIGFAFLSANEQPTDMLSVSESVQHSIESETSKRSSIYFDVRFGRFSKNCKGYGVCKIRWDAAKNTGLSGRGNVARALAQVEDGRVVSLQFYKNTISEKTMKNQFKDGVFVVEEDFETSLSRQGKEILFSLKAGKYKLKETKLGFNLGMPPN